MVWRRHPAYAKRGEGGRRRRGACIDVMASDRLRFRAGNSMGYVGIRIELVWEPGWHSLDGTIYSVDMLLK